MFGERVIERPFDDPLSDSRRAAEPSQRKRRWACRKPAKPSTATSARKASCARTASCCWRSGAGRLPAAEAGQGRHREEDFAAKLRHTYATNLLNAGAELVDIKALLGHESIATTPMDTHVWQERMEKVARVCTQVKPSAMRTPRFLITAYSHPTGLS